MRLKIPFILTALLFVTSSFLAAQSAVELGRRFGQITEEALAKTGVPSASVAVVKGGELIYSQAHGSARLEPRVSAKPEMRYSIGSISKQFAAVAMLMLQEQGKLSLDDKVAKYFPDLTRAGEVSLRQLLSHTSGYQDYWPQDYAPPFMLQPVTPQRILDLWARKPLDFDPGTAWQYSNTNYVIAGLIVEKASGVPLFQFLQNKVFAPLAMTSVLNVDQDTLTSADPLGYMRYALGSLRPSEKEGKGWIFAAGELAMTAGDLAKWDISILDRKLMAAASYHELETEVLLKNGLATGYGLGVDVGKQSEHRMLSHGGEVLGFTAENVVFPDDRAAIVVLTNQDAARAAVDIANHIAPLLFAVEDPAAAKKLAQAQIIFDSLQRGAIDRSIFSDNANAYFTPTAVSDFAKSLAPLGHWLEFVPIAQEPRGGMMLRSYRVKFANKMLRVWTYELPDGKLEQYLVAAVE